MKKIADVTGTMSMACKIKEALFGEGVNFAACRYDVYAEDDGTIRVCKHKVPFEEAEKIAEDWLFKNNAYFITAHLSYNTPFRNVIICTYISNGEVKIGAARFNEKDERRSYIIGKALSYSRASGKKLPSELAEYLGIQQ